MSSHSGEVALTKVYNLKDTSYFLILSKIITYQSNDDGISPRKIKKGSKSVLLLSNNVRTEVTAMQEVIEKKESKKAGSIGSLKEHRHSFKILYYLTPEQLDLLSEKSLVTLRVNMEDNLGNSAFQDIEVKEKFQNTIQNLLGCLKSRFVQR